ncbi:uncharacterized protein LOC119684660 isoform X2 [Teleopsis dalmanni]|nr:uncharacterized protein LOC119684660 isoform X2 [Teleopsis dalmanni]
MEQFKGRLGISDFEINEICDYFKLRDGRVAYQQMSKAVYNSSELYQAKKDFSTGCELNDPFHVNALPLHERHRIFATLIKVSTLCMLPLSPYFEDYSVISRNKGTITVSHFLRVLYFLKVQLSEEEVTLILKRYMRDGYLVNYVAFIKHVENISKYIKENDLTDPKELNYKYIPSELANMHLTEMNKSNYTHIPSKVFPNPCNHPKDRNICDTIFFIQEYVYQKSIRVREFLEIFDYNRSGKISASQFERFLGTIQLRNSLNDNEIKALCKRYECPRNKNFIMWRKFENEIDEVFTIKNLDKSPLTEVTTPAKHIKNRPRIGSLNWDKASNLARSQCENAVNLIQVFIRNRHIHMRPYFQSYDKLHHGHVNCYQLNKILKIMNIDLSNDELNGLYDRYGDATGFNYVQFLEDVDCEEDHATNLPQPRQLHAKCDLPAEKFQTDEDYGERIMEIIYKIKRQLLRRFISIIDILRDYDRHNRNEILDLDFRRALSGVNVNLSPHEFDILCETFKSPRHPNFILYRNFGEVLNKVSVVIETVAGDKVTTTYPLLHFANQDCQKCWLNYDERTLCSEVLRKLARKHDNISNLGSLFQDFDRRNCGTITRNQFRRALTTRYMHVGLNEQEFEVLYKCFGMNKGIHQEINYRDFLKVINTCAATGQMKLFY